MQLSWIFYSIIASISMVIAASINDCKNDVDSIYPLVANLNKAIQNFPNDGGSLSDGIGTSFSNSDSRAIANSVEAFVPQLLQLLSGVVEKEPYIIKIKFPGIKGLVRNALANLRHSIIALFDTCIATLSNPVKGELQSSKAKINAAFEKADKAFS
ncbi:hypothetical protein H0H87_011235 [Tephrocybe sp. NHM501043]|nr:hypothetical protein H0H87_011235 [Tephrocybe sp. NHM501043]